MIFKIKEGNFVIYSGLKGYNYINQVLNEAFEKVLYMHVITSINWRENKKYFKNE